MNLAWHSVHCSDFLSINLKLVKSIKLLYAHWNADRNGSEVSIQILFMTSAIIFMSALLRNNVHALKFALLKCKFIGFHYIQSCIIIITNFRICSLSQKEITYPLGVTLHLLATTTVYIDLSIQDISYKWDHICNHFFTVFSHSIMFSWFIHIVACFRMTNILFAK